MKPIQVLPPTIELAILTMVLKIASIFIYFRIFTSILELNGHIANRLGENNESLTQESMCRAKAYRFYLRHPSSWLWCGRLLILAISLLEGIILGLTWAEGVYLPILPVPLFFGIAGAVSFRISVKEKPELSDE